MQILQIVHSYSITESEIKRLEELVGLYLEDYKNKFNENLRPKHHFLLHYARVIRSMGPVIWFWVMRMESKHQFFKRIAQKTSNFINLKKTMAEKHQEKVYLDSFIKLKLWLEKKIPIDCCNEYEKYEDTIKQVITESMIEEVSIVNSIEINNIKFKTNYLFEYNGKLHEIDYIVAHKNTFWFLCSFSYDIKKFDGFLNSLLLKKFEKIQIICFDQLKNVKAFEKKYLNNETYILADCLNLYHFCDLIVQ